MRVDPLGKEPTRIPGEKQKAFQKISGITDTISFQLLSGVRTSSEEIRNEYSTKGSGNTQGPSSAFTNAQSALAFYGKTIQGQEE